MDVAGQWYDAYENIHAGRSTLSGTPCPSCGSKLLQLVFLVDHPASERSTFVFWCDACLRGLPPGPAPRAEGFLPTVRGTEPVPNFCIVKEEPE
ncbi:hypothetical protein [Cellulomonas massiliensis]|uniref:hypothetical protein n=1 Tax=Cellulomonas massiliensis TaxID=1465811 RepID=UPI0002EA378F|nr:hypothetical protein [Cellulomonas massiliensis]